MVKKHFKQKLWLKQDTARPCENLAAEIVTENILSFLFVNYKWWKCQTLQKTFKKIDCIYGNSLQTQQHRLHAHTCFKYIFMLI